MANGWQREAPDAEGWFLLLFKACAGDKNAIPRLVRVYRDKQYGELRVMFSWHDDNELKNYAEDWWHPANEPPALPW